MHEVFISFSSRDRNVALNICKFLEDNGISCWIAPRNVDAGTNYATQIVSAIKRCRVFVLAASVNTNESGHVSNEVSLAFDNKKPIIPFKIEDFCASKLKTSNPNFLDAISKENLVRVEFSKNKSATEPFCFFFCVPKGTFFS